MGAFPAALTSTIAESRERDKDRKAEKKRRRVDIALEQQDKADKQERGRAALIRTTPRGILGSQTSGRKKLTPA